MPKPPGEAWATAQLPSGVSWPSTTRQFLRMYAVPGVSRIGAVPPVGSYSPASRRSTNSPSVRDRLKPSTLTTGTTMTRALRSRPVMRSLRPKFFARSVANSIASSPLGHSRAWWTPISRNVGSPRLGCLTPWLISTP